MTLWKPHSPKQERAIKSEKPILLCGTGIQYGKAITYATNVLTPDGYVPAVSIAVGDTLFDRSGKETKVIGVFPQGVRDCYRITFRDGRHIDTDGEHLNIIIPRTSRPERKMTTAEIFATKFLHGKGQIPACKPIELPHRDLPIDPYTLGVLLGDGCLRTAIMITTPDLEIVERIRAAVTPNDFVLNEVNSTAACKSYLIAEKVRKTTSLGHPRNRMKEELEALGLWGSLSDVKFIPHAYKFASIEQRLDILRGLCDTDGYAAKNRHMQFYSTSKRLADDVTWLVESLGGKAWLSEKDGKYKKPDGEVVLCKKCYTVNMIMPHFNPFWLPRKANEYWVHENTPNKVIYSVGRIDPAKTVCFAVSSDTKTFIIENQVVTHNSTIGAVRMAIKMHKYTSGNDAFIVTAPTYKIMQQATLPAFMSVMGAYGEYSKSDHVFTMRDSGAKCYFRTGTEPDSIVGITNVRHIWGDEAGKYSLYFWENIQGRASFKQAQVDLTTSPYSLNWIFHDLIKPTKDGTRSDVEWVHAASYENPFFPMAEYRRKEKTMDPRRFKMMYGGVWDRMAGLVYDCLDVDVHVIDPMPLPPGTLYAGGIDWGFTEPFVLTIRGITPDNRHYQISETYKTGLTVSEIVRILKQKQSIYKLDAVFCGPDRPENISELCRNGIKALPADNDVRLGLDRHYELIKSGRFHIFKGSSPKSLDEYATYHYPEPDDLKPDQNAKEQKPVAQNDHAMDSTRYLSIMTYDGLQKVAPHVPTEHNPEKIAQAKRLEMLKRKTREYDAVNW